MNPSPSSLPIDELLAHEGWLRRLVRELVDEHEVDDVVQETWAAALGTPAAVQKPRAWLRRVAENLAFRTRRTEVRRRRRETSAARADELPSTATMLERVHAQRAVAEAVAGLDEPYRTAVLLRYFEGLAPKEIAARTGIEASTVRSRVERGLQRIRGRLEGQGFAAIAAAVLRPPASLDAAPLADAAAAATPAGGSSGIDAAARDAVTRPRFPLIELFAMSASTRIATIVVATTVLTVGGLGFWASSTDSDPTTAPTVTPAAPSIAVAPAATAPAQPAIARAPAATPVEPTPGPTASATPPALTGRVVDRFGRAVAGVTIRFEPTHGSHPFDPVLGVAPYRERTPRAETTSDGDGRFALAASAATGDGELWSAPPWTTVRGFTPPAVDRAASEALLVVAPTTTVRGRVLDPDGVSIPAARVVARVDSLRAFPSRLEHAHSVALGDTRTDADGRFELTDVADLEELELMVVADGFEVATLAEFDRARDVLITLPRPDDATFRVTGTVVDANDRPAAGAHVVLNQSHVETDRHGDFELELSMLAEATPLFFGKPGHRTVADDGGIARRLLDGETRVHGVVLRLGGAPLAIRGVVRGPDGEPCPNAVVTIADPMHLGMFQTGEDLARGVRGELAFDGINVKVDARTAADGSFTIDGLADRDYSLRVLDPHARTTRLVGPVRAGTTDVEVELDPGRVWREVTGVVRTRDGHPFAGARVSAQLVTFATDSLTVSAPATESTTTDEHGRFKLTDVPRDLVHVSVAHGDLIGTDTDLDAAVLGRGGSLEIVAMRRCTFRVDANGRHAADQFRILDADGNTLELRKTQSQYATVMTVGSLRGGRSATLSTSELAATIVFLDDDVEVGRQAITLRPTGVTELR